MLAIGYSVSGRRTEAAEVKIGNIQFLHGAEIRSASSIHFVLDSMGLNGFTVTLTGLGLVRANGRHILTRLDYAFHDGHPHYRPYITSKCQHTFSRLCDEKQDSWAT